jgi:hypothetical protein
MLQGRSALSRQLQTVVMQTACDSLQVLLVVNLLRIDFIVIHRLIVVYAWLSGIPLVL